MINSLLFNYVFRRCFGSIISVLAFVITLHLLLRFADIRELSWPRLKPVVYELPNTILLFMPIAILIGGLLAMGGMNTRNEITALRASGASRVLCSIPLISISVILAIVMMITMELLTPRLYANMGLVNPSQFRVNWIYENDSYWKLINDTRRQTIRVDQYHRNMDGYLDGGLVDGQKLDSQHIQVGSQHQWSLTAMPTRIHYNTSASTLVIAVPDKIASPFSDQQLKYGLQPSAAWMTVQALKTQHQPYKEADNALWRMLLLPLTYLSVAMIVLPFVFATDRQVNTGKRLFIGVVIGLGFYVVSRLIGSLSLVYPIPAMITIAISPILLTGIATKLLTKRL